MPYYLYDANGYLADGPTRRGLRGLAPHLTGEEGTHLLQEGATDNPLALRAELVDAQSDDPAVRSSLAALVRAAGRADSLLILTDGVDVTED